MSRENTEQKHRMIRFGVLIGVLLLAIYGFFDLTKRLDDAKKNQSESSTDAAETND